VDPLDPLERDLRDLLTDERLALPAHLVGLDRVRAGVARRRRRRTAVTAAAAALVVGAVGVSASLAHGGRFSTTPAVETSPTNHTDGSPSPEPSSSPTTSAIPTGPAWGDAAVTSVTATSTRTVVVLGRTTGRCAPTCLRLAETHDGGKTWTSLPVPSDATAVDDVEGARRDDASSVRFGSGLDGWIFGGGLWSSHDGGESWTAMDLPGVVDRLEAAGGTAWALVDVGDSTEQLWQASVGSDEWRRVADVEVKGPADLAVQGPRVVVLGTDRGWSNASGSFQEVDDPCGRSSLEVRLSGSGSLWATCVTGNAAFLATSTDSGVTWTTVPTDESRGSLPNSIPVGARTGAEAMVWLGDGTGLARMSADGTLTPVKDLGTGVSWLGFTDPRVGYAVTCCSIGTLARTDDGGATWRVLDIRTG
jgi:photosystem II stability/assembly factor-like uncharacterized protein